MNVVVLRGVLSSEPRSKDLPSGALLVNWEVTTSTPDGKLTVPVSWFDPPKSLRSFGAGTEVVVTGAVRRRYYSAGGRTVSATEVLADAGCAARRSGTVAALIDKAISRLDQPG